MGRPGEPPSGHQQTKPIFPRAKSSRQSSPKMIKKIKQEIKKNYCWTWSPGRRVGDGGGEEERASKERKQQNEDRHQPEREEASPGEEERPARDHQRERSLQAKKLAVSPPESS